jgi:hypothetical protein
MPNRAFVHAATSQGYTYNANRKRITTFHPMHGKN